MYVRCRSRGTTHLSFAWGTWLARARRNKCHCGGKWSKPLAHPRRNPPPRVMVLALHHPCRPSHLVLHHGMVEGGGRAKEKGCPAIAPSAPTGKCDTFHVGESHARWFKCAKRAKAEANRSSLRVLVLRQDENRVWDGHATEPRAAQFQYRHVG